MPKFTILEEGHYYKLHQDGKTVAVLSECDEETAEALVRKLNGEIDIDAANAALDGTAFHIGRGSWQTLEGEFIPSIWAGPKDEETFRDFSVVEDGDETFSAFRALAGAINRREQFQLGLKHQRDELLEALKIAHKAMRFIGLIDSYINYNEAEIATKAVEAAIAKAEGKPTTLTRPFEIVVNGRTVETIDVEVTKRSGEEFLTPDSSEKIEQVRAKYLPPEGWTLSECGHFFLREGDGVWIVECDDKYWYFEYPYIWTPHPSALIGEPSFKGTLYRIPVDKEGEL